MQTFWSCSIAIFARTGRRCSTEMLTKKTPLPGEEDPAAASFCVRSGEEDLTGHDRQGLGRRKKPRRNLFEPLDGAACDIRNVAAGNTQIVQFAVRQTAQLVNSVTVAPPITVVTDQVHFLTSIVWRKSAALCFVRQVQDRYGNRRCGVLLLHSSIAICAMHQIGFAIG